MAVTSPNGRRCGVGPNVVASRTPSQPAAGTGAAEPVLADRCFGERDAQEGAADRRPRSRPRGPRPGRGGRPATRLTRPTSRAMVTGSWSAARTVTVASPFPVGRTTASARPSKVRQASASKRSAVFGLALHRPASTAAPETSTVTERIGAGDQPTVGVSQLDGDEGEVGVVGAQPGPVGVRGQQRLAGGRQGRAPDLGAVAVGHGDELTGGVGWSPAPPASGRGWPTAARARPRCRPAAAPPRRRRRTPRR